MHKPSRYLTESEKRSAASAIGSAIGGRRTYSGTKKWWRNKNHKGLEWRVSYTTDDEALEVMVKPSEVGEGEAVYFDASESFPMFKSDLGNIEYEDADQFVNGVVQKMKNQQNLREVIREQIVKMS
jgi:hypothetical protein